MNYLDIIIQLFLLISGLITLFGSYYESKDKRRRFYGFTPRQLVSVGGALTVGLTIINSIKTALDGKKLEDTIQSNISLTRKIDLVTSRNIEMTKITTELTHLNYSLSKETQKNSETSLHKADTLLTKAQNIIDNSTGGESFCVIDFIPVKGIDTATRHIVNLGAYPLRNLTVYAFQKEENWNRYNTNTVLDYVKTIGILYPGKLFKSSDLEAKTFIINIVENLAGFNLVPVKVSRIGKNIRQYYFVADNGFWHEYFEMFHDGKQWHKHTTVYRNRKKIYDKTYVF